MNIGQIDIKGIRLSFWDLGGQQELWVVVEFILYKPTSNWISWIYRQSLWDKYYQESHAIIYVVDSFDRERMDESKAVFGM